MRTFIILAASALLLGAVVIELTTRLWPDSYLALLFATVLALLVQGYLALRTNTTGSSESAPAPAPARKPTKKAPAPRKAQSQAETQPVADGPRETGTVKWFNRSKGFGFVVRESGEEIFVHQRSMRMTGEGENRRRPSLRDGQTVTFSVAHRDKGLQAEDVDPS